MWIAGLVFAGMLFYVGWHLAVGIHSAWTERKSARPTSWDRP